MARRALLACAALAALVAFLWTAPAITIIGNVTVDVVDGKKALGGAVSYAAAVASALGVRACIVTARGPHDAAIDRDFSALFEGHDLVVVHADHTLVFHHTYTFWGNHRKLRVTAQPNVTLAWEHLPARCRRARTLLLGPLMPEDLDPVSFVRHAARPWWQRALGLPGQQVGLMAQGLQRGLDSAGRVRALAQPSALLADALGPDTLVFLSDVETEVWPNGTVAELAARTQRFLVTRGKEGADEWRGPLVQRIPVFPIDTVLDTNGAGDTFATAYMIAAAAGHPNPIALAHHAAGLAVSQPQKCKPRCVTTALESGLGPQLAMLRGWAPVQRLVLPPLQLMARLLGLAARGSSGGGSSTAAS